MLAKYQEISHFIREQIRSRKWAPGSRLPTRSELVREYGTTVMTLQKAMDELMNEGFIVSEGKRGTFVSAMPPNLSTFAVVYPADPDTHSGWDELWTILGARKRQFEEQFRLRFEFYYIGQGNLECEDFRRLVGDGCSGRLAGVIFPMLPADYMVAPFLEAGLPCVAVTRDEVPGVNTVWVDFADFLRRSCDTLLASGVRRPALISNQQLPFDYASGLSGYAKERGVPIPPGFLLGVSFERKQEEWSRNVIRLLLQQPPELRPDGLIVANENLSGLVLNVLYELNLRVGEDIRLVQHTNFPSSHRPMAGVSRIGFDIRALLEGCLDELRRCQRTGEVSHLKLIPAVDDSSLSESSAPGVRA